MAQDARGVQQVLDRHQQTISVFEGKLHIVFIRKLSAGFIFQPLRNSGFHLRKVFDFLQFAVKIQMQKSETEISLNCPESIENIFLRSKVRFLLFVTLFLVHFFEKSIIIFRPSFICERKIDLSQFEFFKRFAMFQFFTQKTKILSQNSTTEKLVSQCMDFRNN